MYALPLLEKDLVAPCKSPKKKISKFMSGGYHHFDRVPLLFDKKSSALILHPYGKKGKKKKQEKKEQI